MTVLCKVVETEPLHYTACMQRACIRCISMQLTTEMLELVRSGAAPVPPRDRGRYFDLVSASLNKHQLARTRSDPVGAARIAATAD
jgi:hypothetical protein